MRKFSRSIQRRRAVLFTEAPGVTSAEAAAEQTAAIESTPEYKNAQLHARREQLRRQMAALGAELDSLRS